MRKRVSYKTISCDVLADVTVLTVLNLMQKGRHWVLVVSALVLS